MKQMTGTLLKVDFALYTVGVLSGLLVMLGNSTHTPTHAPASADTYMERIIARMDSVSIQLARWEHLDVQQYR